MKSVLCLLALTLGCPLARAAVLYAITEGLPTPSSAQIITTTETVRSGTTAFRHVTRAGGEAAEFVIPAATVGDERWYGWSTQLPPDFEHRGRSTLLMQLAEASPAKTSQCPVAASSLEINAKGQVIYHLHTPEAGSEPKCRAFTLATDVAPTRGRWFDLVLHAKWTDGADGFVELWVKQHDNNFLHVVDYRGPTCAGKERGPEFRIGAHVSTSEPDTNAEVAVFTDEIRVGDASASFDDVAPPGATLRAAGAKRGEIHYVVYPSPLNRRKIPVMVYTPPGYDAKNAKRYPVIYNLHGAGGGSPERQWSRMHATLTDAMESAAVPPTIYVFANALGDGGYIDYPEGRGPKIFSSIVTELVSFIDANYRTIADRRGRGVDGFSMGAGGSLQFAFKRSDLFSAVVAYAAGFIPHDPNDANELRRKLSAEFSHYALVQRHADEIRERVRVRLVCGEQDPLYPANLKFKAFLEEQKIPFSWVSIPGVAHDTKGLFDQVGVESLKFMHEAFAKDR